MMMERRVHSFEKMNLDRRKQTWMPRDIRCVVLSCSLLRAASVFWDFYTVVSGNWVTWKLAAYLSHGECGDLIVVRKACGEVDSMVR